MYLRVVLTEYKDAGNIYTQVIKVPWTVFQRYDNKSSELFCSLDYMLETLNEIVIHGLRYPTIT